MPGWPRAGRETPPDPETLRLPRREKSYQIFHAVNRTSGLLLLAIKPKPGIGQPRLSYLSNHPFPYTRFILFPTQD